MKNKTLQEQYNLLKEGKWPKDVFMKSAKQQFPHLINNSATLNETVGSLKHNHIISENLTLGKVITDTPAEPDWFKIFKENVTEEVKAVEKKTSKEVEEVQDANFDYKDLKNIDNVFGEQFLTGYYCEMKDPKNEKKTIEELKSIVAKNLAKDKLYYVKDGQFGVKGLGYTEDHPGLGAPKDPKGKWKSSGYGDLDKAAKAKLNEAIGSESTNLTDILGKILKEEDSWELEEKVHDIIHYIFPSMIPERWEHNLEYFKKLDFRTQLLVLDSVELNPNQLSKEDIEFKLEKWGEDEWLEFNDELENVSYARNADKWDRDMGLMESNLPLGEKPKKKSKPKKKKKPSTDDKLSEIEANAKIATLEMQIEALDEIINSKNQRIELVQEDESLSELIDKKKIKELQKEVKNLNKKKDKMVKTYEKLSGKSYKEVVTDEDNDMVSDESDVHIDEKELSLEESKESKNKTLIDAFNKVLNLDLDDNEDKAKKLLHTIYHNHLPKGDEDLKNFVGSALDSWNGWAGEWQSYVVKAIEHLGGKNPIQESSQYQISMGKKGNDTIVYNKKQIKNDGGYKEIAKISKKGTINYLDDKIPSSIKKAIEAEADKKKK